MDTPVAPGPGGSFTVDAGTYRLTAWISGVAFGLLPWNSPGRKDIEAAVKSAGGWQSDPSVYLQLDKDKPADWPDESGVTIPGDAFVVRAEGTWTGLGSTIAQTLAIPDQSEPLHVAAVWAHGASASAPGPAPGGPAPPGHRGGPPPAPRPPSSPPPGTVDVGSGEAPASGRRAGLFSGLALVGLVALIARSRMHRAFSHL
jgi:hypothetical protein